MKKLFLAIIASLILLPTYGQYVVKGKIMDSENTVMPMVNVAFLNQVDSTLVSGAVSDSCGVYSTSLAGGNYIIRYSYLGYQTLYKDVKVHADLALPVVRMEVSQTTLKDVEVTAYRKPFKLDRDGLLADVENTILSQQTNLNDLLCKIPGIQQRGNSVEVIGKGNPVYYINGREVVDKTELDNLSVDQIRSVKLILNPGVRYHSEQRAIIEIKTRRLGDGFAFNVKGNLQQGNHFNQNYLINGSYNYKNWDFFFSYNYNRGKNNSALDAYQQTQSDTIWNLTNLNRKRIFNECHTYTGGVSYHFSPESEIGLKYEGKYSQGNTFSNDTLSMIPDKGVSTFIKNLSDVSAKSVSNHFNLYYMNDWKNGWRMNAYGDYLHKTDHSRGNICEWESDRTETSMDYYRKADWDLFAAKFSLSYETEKAGAFNLGYDFSHTSGTDYIEYVRALNNGRTHNTEMKNSVYLSYDYTWKNLSLGAGLRYEQIRSELKETHDNKTQYQTYHNFLPSVSLSYNTEKLQQSLAYSIHTERPPFDVMNDNAVYTDRFTYQKGNLYLKQALTHDLNYMLFYKFLFLNLNYTLTRDPLVTAFYSMPGNSAVTVSYMDNFDKMHNLTGMVNVQYPVKWWMPSLTLTCIKTFFHYPGPDGTTLKSGRPLVMLNFNNSFTLPSGFLLSADFNYGSKGYYQLYESKGYTSLNLSLKKSFLNDKLQLSLDAYDIFNKNNTRASARLHDIIMNTVGKEETRKVGFTITYRFRTEKKMNNQRAAESEMSRLNMDNQ